MRGIKDFNFPAFFDAADQLRELGHTVFNPAEKDIEKYGPAVGKGKTGDPKDVEHLGFNLNEALHADLTWICTEAEAIYMLAGWEKSKGACAELAVAKALGLEVIMEQVNSTKAQTYDDGKEPLAHLPWAALNELSRVQAYGQKKYGDFYNYRKGMEVSRNLSCALRHIRDYMGGGDKDHESGLHPLAHALCRLSFILQNIHDKVAIDDRYKGEKK